MNAYSQGAFSFPCSQDPSPGDFLAFFKGEWTDFEYANQEHLLGWPSTMAHFGSCRAPGSGPRIHKGGSQMVVNSAARDLMLTSGLSGYHHTCGAIHIYYQKHKHAHQR